MGDFVTLSSGLCVLSIILQGLLDCVAMYPDGTERICYLSNYVPTYSIHAATSFLKIKPSINQS
jgi:hypothetical protein